MTQQKKYKAVRVLHEAGFSLREIQNLLHYKNHNSVSYALKKTQDK